MGIALLRGENIRLYRTLEIEPHPQLNLIIGSNAAGKTTLLEMMFVAARGRSFRAQSLAELSGTSGGAWTAFMEVSNQGQRERLGVGWTRGRAEIRLNEQKGARLSEVIRAVPLQLIDPATHRLLEEGPSYRRSYVDWGVFHVEQRFHDIWKRFHSGLRQRNSALREGLPDGVVHAWNEELSNAAEQLDAMREAHVLATHPSLARWTQRLVGEGEVRCEWQRGWPAAESYLEVLERNLEQHRRMGTTVQGPHRAELRISLAESRAKGRVSRGQQKMLVSAMILAQAETLAAAGISPPVLLLDDFASELSAEFQLRLADGLKQYCGQKFVTAFEVPAAFGDSEAAMFHVEHGLIRRLH